MTKAIILSGNITGAGKTTVWEDTRTSYPNHLVRIVSYATRDPRPGEVNGVDYRFISVRWFRHQRDTGQLYEFTDQIPGRYYGVPLKPIERTYRSGKIACFVTDFRGIDNLAGVADVVLKLWVTAPYDQLVRRIGSRETDQAEIAKRIQSLETEKDWFENERPHDLQIVTNLDGRLDAALAKARRLVDALIRF